MDDRRQLTDDGRQLADNGRQMTDDGRWVKGDGLWIVHGVNAVTSTLHLLQVDEGSVQARFEVATQVLTENLLTEAFFKLMQVQLGRLPGSSGRWWLIPLAVGTAVEELQLECECFDVNDSPGYFETWMYNEAGKLVGRAGWLV